MIKAVTLWKLPDGVTPEAFERWYEEKHVPEVAATPGLLRYETCRMHAGFGAGGDYYRMAEFTFESLGTMELAMSSGPWRAAVSDAGNWIASPVRYVCDTAVRIPAGDL